MKNEGGTPNATSWGKAPAPTTGANGAAKEKTMEAMIKAVKEAKRQHPELSDLGIWALLSGGDKEKSALIGDALNAVAEAGQ